jgi:hypothetical protein
MRTTSKKWIEAARILTADPSAIVRCPENDDGILIVTDVVSVVDPNIIERHLICDKCRERNVIRMKITNNTIC